MKDLLWLDLETTGLDPDNDEILMVAASRTDEAGKMMTSVLTTVSPTKALKDLDPVVQEMHTRSGLWDMVCSDGKTAREAEARVFQLIAPGEKLVLAGNSIHFDRRFIIKHMPALHKVLHYRMLDVSSLKVAAGVWGIPPAPTGEKKHLALYDIKDSIAEFLYYRKAFGAEK
jgi:oligoribonuclease